ncbi:hypothetical protein [Planctomicrobium piriforme]|uniref:PD-(D/E)XK nuclease superfamily protein n=1 Tax=Planctomicrobium piriforme TaxID=1576369 RepID=A0A1I3TK28_9PLAN|nr:hypothetical protein [Planctomicrobium piriforme]SFJ70759.1 PD-(D/E)XK nuclease superfamily protein [Planctomicrobium piriforme]
MSGSTEDNLLSALHHWASAQDENFITEAFVGLLRRLLTLDPPVGVALISWLTDGQINVPLTEAIGVSVATQVSSDLGRPDICICTVNALAFIEAKLESKQGELQLQRYRQLLDRSPAMTRSLTLLSRYAEEIDPGLQGRVICRRWNQAAQFLVDALEAGKIHDTVNQWFTEQFVDFLKSRGMVMEQVSWELMSGVRSMISLLEMLKEAALAAKVRPIPSIGKEWNGYYLAVPADMHGTEYPYFFGYVFDRPNLIQFSTEKVGVIPTAVDVAGCGKLQSYSSSPTKQRWTIDLILDSEEVHFFALSRSRQLQVLEEFLNTALATAERVRLPRQ